MGDLQTESLVENYIRSVLKSIDPSWATAPLSVEKLTGGERHYLFKAVCGREDLRGIRKVIVRINAIPGEYERNKARREARVLAFLGSKLAPQLYHFDESARYFPEPAMVTSLVEGVSVPLEELSLDAIESLGIALAELHGLDTSELSGDLKPQAMVRSYKDYLVHRFEWDVNRKLPVGDIDLPWELMGRCWRAHGCASMAVVRGLSSEAFDIDHGFSLLHGDLGSDNVLWSQANGVTLIDWEDARLGDPAEEIAYLFTENSLHKARRRAFWNGYSRQSTLNMDALRKRVAIWEPVTAVGSTVWWLDRYIRRLMATDADTLLATPKSPSYYLEEVDERLNRFERHFIERHHALRPNGYGEFMWRD